MSVKHFFFFNIGDKIKGRKKQIIFTWLLRVVIPSLSYVINTFSTQLKQ